MRDQTGFQRVLDEKIADKFSWGVAAYLENRKSLLADCPQMAAEERFIHLGLDIIFLVAYTAPETAPSGLPIVNVPPMGCHTRVPDGSLTHRLTGKRPVTTSPAVALPTVPQRVTTTTLSCAAAYVFIKRNKPKMPTICRQRTISLFRSPKSLQLVCPGIG